MPLSEVLSEHIRAAFSGLYLQTYEPEEALREVGDLCRRERWTLATWDIDRGLSLAGAEAEAANPMTDPLAALRSLSSLATADSTALLVLKNFQRFLGSAEIIQALQHQLALGKQLRTFVLILAPVVQLPVELERLFVVLHHELPHREQLAALARAVATEAQELPTGPEFDQLLDAAVGLTRCEAENAFALSLVRHGRLQPDVLWDQKAQALLKSGLLTLHRGRDAFADLGGLANLKAFCLRALRSPARQRLGLTPRGVLLLGVPGTGKTAFAKALGHETGRPTLAQTTRTPLAPSRTYCGAVPGVAAAYRRPATSLRTTRPTAARPRSGATLCSRVPRAFSIRMSTCKLAEDCLEGAAGCRDLTSFLQP